LVFLPSLQPYSVFQFVHNRFHHQYTNLLTDDWVWRPLTLSEYRAATHARRWLYRFERGPCGFLLYYVLEIWARRLAFPFYRELGTVRSAFALDALLIWSFLVTEVAFLLSWGYEAAGIVGALRFVCFGVAIPLLVYNSLIGMFLYLQHTHPDIPWFAKREDWQFFRAQVSSSVHVDLPAPIDALFQKVLHHTAHHAMPQIPSYHLEEAQRRLEKRYAGQITTLRWSPRAYLSVTRQCKLYDDASNCWVDYNGKPTTGPLVQS
jgi:omega-6 fatty acid desaturase (delta-12 desaturase)